MSSTDVFAHRSAADALAGAMRYAQKRAIAGRTEIWVRIDTAAGTVRFCRDTALACAQPLNEPGAQSVLVFQAPAGITMTVTPLEPPRSPSTASAAQSDRRPPPRTWCSIRRAATAVVRTWTETGLTETVGRRSEPRPTRQRRQRGVTLVETILVIVIGGVVLASIAGAIAYAAARSADTWPLKQSLAVAEGLLGEITLKPSTRCDADGPAPAGSGTCAIADAVGPETGESRFSYTAPFDHPDDYDGFSMAAPPGIRKLDGTAVAGLEAYSASVSVQAQALDGIPSSAGLWVTVTVTGPAGTSVRLQTFVARYAP